jgi:hypothetical protein
MVILSDAYKMKISDKCLECRINLKNDSVVFISIKFIYLINGRIFDKKEKFSKLKSLNPDKIISFNVYSKSEASEILGIKTKYGLIKIETR